MPPTSTNLPLSRISVAAATTEPPAKRRRKINICIVTLITVLIGACLVSALVVGWSAVQLQGWQRESELSLGVLNQFMRAGTHNDPQAAYALFPTATSGIWTTLTPQDISTLFQTRRDLFDGYKALLLQRYTVHSGINGRTNIIEGSITYTNRPPVPFTAYLTSQDNQWQLLNVQFVEASPK